jgi:homogentisate 1,2-dioxygenase
MPSGLLTHEWTEASTPNLHVWRKASRGREDHDFVSGLTTVAGAGDANTRNGLAIHLYSMNRSMGDSCFANRDGELLLLPEEGEIRVQTELGCLQVRPGELCVVPADIRFSAEPAGSRASGLLVELFGRHLELPERGLIGANGLADERHFLTPTAQYENRTGVFSVIVKQGGRLFRATQPHSPFDVVAWHGNYVPYKYDLELFAAYGSVRWDHPDPSILTVLTCPIADRGTSMLDLSSECGHGVQRRSSPAVIVVELLPAGRSLLHSANGCSRSNSSFRRGKFRQSCRGQQHTTAHRQ